VTDLIKQLGPLALGSRLRRLSDRLYKDISEIYARLDLEFEPRWFPVLYLLSENQAMAVTEVAQHVGLTHPAVHQIAGAMDAAGLLDSARDSDDQRRRLLQLSPRGRELAAALRPVWASIAAASAELAASNDGDLLDMLDGIEAALDAESMVERVARHGSSDAT